MRADAIDFLVRGAGPVGCVAALALAQAGMRVALHGKESGGTPASRPIVLSYASRLILERLGVWGALVTSPIRAIHVSQAGRFGRTVFDADDCGVPDLGYVLEYSQLQGALLAAARPLLGAEATPRCVIHAEGVASDAEEKRYPQDAVVAVVRFSIPAAETAYERFTQGGPLALLPLAGRYALVWTMPPERSRELAQAPEAEFLAALAKLTPARLGRPLAAEARTIHPLSLRFRRTTVQGSEVYIGNAAQTLHPVAGQGLNVGMRDAWELAQIMRAQEPADTQLLARYAASRRLDATAAIRVTDFLARAFLKSNALSGVALTALDILPAPRRFFARRMIYGTTALP